MYYTISICTVEVVSKELLTAKEKGGAATYSVWTYQLWNIA